jgi:membrane protein YqaA with SNARE-associated domain
LTDLTGYFALFGAAFLAATIFPAQSEVLLVGMLASDRYSTAGLIAVASLGNVLGAVVNWLLGRGIERFRDRKWFPVGPDAFERAAGWYRRYGRWSLLFSWLPLGGDALTVVAGTLREPLWSFLILVSIGKVARYLVLAAATAGVF